MGRTQEAHEDQVRDLADVQDDAEGRGAHHEVGKDVLLRGVANVAADFSKAGPLFAFHNTRQEEAVVDDV